MRAETAPGARSSAVRAGSPVTPVVLAVVFLTVPWSLLLGLGAAPLFDVDEGAFSQATMEMFQRGDFLSTYLDGAPRYDKPILIYWLQAASVAVFGASEFAFRLPSALAAIGWTAVTAVFAWRLFDARVALTAAVLLSGALGVYAIGRAATADALLNLLIAVSMFAAYLHLANGARRWLYLTHAAIGLGVLTKGPVAVLVPLAVTFLFCLLRRDLRTWLRAVFDWRAVALLVAIAAPWYLAIMIKEGWAFYEGFILKHNVGRFSGPMLGHTGSLVYYLPVVLLLTLPFTALLWPVIRSWREVVRDELQLYLLLWFGFVLVFFSLSGTKLPHYVLYGLTGLVLLMSVHAWQLRSSLALLAPAALLIAGMIGFGLFAVGMHERIGDPYFRAALAEAGTRFDTSFFAVLAVALAVVIVVLPLANAQPRSGSASRLPQPLLLAVVALICTGLLSLLVVPRTGALVQGPVREAGLLARERGWDAVAWRINAPSFSVYRGEPTPRRAPEPGEVALARVDRAHEAIASGWEVLYRQGGVVLLRAPR